MAGAAPQTQLPPAQETQPPNIHFTDCTFVEAHGNAVCTLAHVNYVALKFIYNQNITHDITVSM